MERSVEFRLNNVSPTPASLRLRPHVDAPASETTVNLGNLFLQYYFDSYGTAAPKPDPSRFEYLDLVSAATDFRFHAHVTSASKVKRRSLATEIGQAFCRLMLAEHFAITHFAHLDEVMGKSAHGAFGGMRVERVCPGDVPDYLCARIAAGPFIAEAKGRFSSIGFHSAAFNNWRTQFTRIELWIPRMFLEAQRDISSRHDWSQTPIPLKIERQATSRIQTLRASHFQNKIDQCWVGVP